MDWAAIGIWTLVIILFLVGFVGTILPAVPGVILVFIGTLVYAFFDGFNSISVGWIVGFGVLTAVAIGTDYLAGIVGAKKFKASRWGIIGAIAGLIVGLFFGPAGIILGPLAGAILFELLAGRNTKQAFRSGWGTFVGFIAGVAIKISVALIVIVLFFYQVFTH